MPPITQLGPTGTPGGRYSFSAKAEAADALGAYPLALDGLVMTTHTKDGEVQLKITKDGVV